MLNIISKSGEIERLGFEDEGGRAAFRHTASHILAQAVKRLYPAAKLAIGPAIETGFYYDFDTDKPFTPEDLTAIEKEMSKIVKESLPLERYEFSPQEALEKLETMGEKYKIELAKELADKGLSISFFKQGEFWDLCEGPHLTNTAAVKSFKLIQTTGAYWRGDINNRQLCRVYGVAFPDKSMLAAHLAMLEEAKKRDHRKLGRELDLFDILEEGKGFPFFYPKGMILRNLLEEFWRAEHTLHGYKEIRTPVILNQELWRNSGHWDHYKDNMYVTCIDQNNHAIKPMNCPGGMLAFKRRQHSYRDMPQRIAELGLVHRHELSGALHGLMRVRCFTQDDAHIFMTPEQIEGEVGGVMELIDRFYAVFGFKYKLELSTRPEDSMGTDEQWEMATAALKNVLDKSGKSYRINEGDGAFYGPKIDFHLEDSIGRTWQCGTIQLDFQMPERFDLYYVGADDEKHRPVMIHRVVFGSIERFIAILTEHYAGAFPLWLSPVQVKIIPIAESHFEYARQLQEQLTAVGLRTETDKRNEKIGYKIREAQLEKIPYMLVIGDNEVDGGTVAARDRSTGGTQVMTAEQFAEMALEKIKNRG